jgi:2-polyprenyl-3-methyl-5-hydroxy-6-metoxy-1,4-benzoquinol methylase
VSIRQSIDSVIFRKDVVQSEGSSDGTPSAQSFDRDFWDERWSDVLREHAGDVAGRAPNAYLTATAGRLAPGRALDAGCGNGSETLWLAARGWQVTGVDFAATALGHGRTTAAALGADIAGRIEWVEGDLAAWTPETGSYDLVTSL